MTDKVLERLEAAHDVCLKRLLCKNMEINDHMVALKSLLGEGGVAVLLQRIHDVGYLSANETKARLELEAKKAEMKAQVEAAVNEPAQIESSATDGDQNV